VQYTIAEHISTVAFPDFRDIAFSCGNAKLATHVLGEKTPKTVFCCTWAFET